MRTLKKYVVAGAIYEGETGHEVQVGNQVKVFLDTATNPAFPEFIFGIIQHPIAKINCGASTSYSLKYDETALLGAVNHLVLDDVVYVTFSSSVDLVNVSQTGTFNNLTGNTTITVPAGCIRYTVYGTFTGSAGTRILILDTANVAAGCVVTVVAELPSIADIILETRNAASGGTLLDTLTTDTSGDNATLEFGFTTSWNRLQSQYPN
jgi:hypothetical protein